LNFSSLPALASSHTWYVCECERVCECLQIHKHKGRGDAAKRTKTQLLVTIMVGTLLLLLFSCALKLLWVSVAFIFYFPCCPSLLLPLSSTLLVGRLVFYYIQRPTSRQPATIDVLSDSTRPTAFVETNVFGESRHDNRTSPGGVIGGVLQL